MARRPALEGTDRRQQILEQALDVFAEKGFDGATAKEIAERADVTHGLIFFYFKDKAELFTAACQQQMDAVILQLDLDADPAAAAESLEVVVRRFVDRLVTTLAEPRTVNLMRVMMRLYMRAQSRDDTAGSYPIRNFGLQLVAALRGHLDDQVRRGALPRQHTDLAAQVIVTVIIHIMIRRVLGDETMAHYSLDELVDSMCALFLHGLPGDMVQPGR